MGSAGFVGAATHSDDLLGAIVQREDLEQGVEAGGVEATGSRVEGLRGDVEQTV